MRIRRLPISGPGSPKLDKPPWAGFNTRTRGEVIQLGLKRILRLFPPSKINFNAVHVAGTNGKGTICFYTSHMLREQGLRVGRFTSPHLVDRWDCINIDGKPVAESTFKNVEAVYRHINDVEEIGASPFEILTATAFDLFNMHQVDVAVIEVGVGGRDDATNILPQEKVLCSVITQIGLDHQALLGNTLTEIAEHKAGIIRRGVPCVYDADSPDEVIQVIQHKASNPRPTPIEWQPRHTRGVFSLAPVINQHAKRQALERGPFEPRNHAAENLFSSLTENNARKRIAVDGWTGPFGDATVPGDFAKPIWMAASAARLSLSRMRMQGATIPDLATLVKGRQFPGRLQSMKIEVLTGRRNAVLLDGAHNVDSARRLASFVARYFRVNDDNKRFRGAMTWLLAASAGKDTAEMLRAMIRPDDTVITTAFGSVDGMPWVKACGPQELHSEARSIQPKLNPASCAVHSVSDALVKASEMAKEGPLVIAGSLYLVSDVLRLVRRDTDPVLWWKKWEKPVHFNKRLWDPVSAESRNTEDSMESADFKALNLDDRAE